MDDTLFIPPCCVDKKLPKAVMQAPRRALSFFTHGDVLVDKFFHAIGYMVDTTPNRTTKNHFCVMVLAMTVSRTSATGYIINYLQICFERGWITHLVLSTDKSVEDFQQDILTWLHIVEDRYHVKPILYTYYKFKEKYLSTPVFEDYPYWIAHYYVDNVEYKGEWKFWQHTDVGKLPGIKGYVDFNIYNGSYYDLKKLTIGNQEDEW